MLFYGNIFGTHMESLLMKSRTLPSLPYFCRRQARIHPTDLLFLRAGTWKCVLQSVLWSRCKGWIWLCFQRAHNEAWAQLSGMRDLGPRWRLFIELRLFLCEFSSCEMGLVMVKQSWSPSFLLQESACGPHLFSSKGWSQGLHDPDCGLQTHELIQGFLPTVARLGCSVIGKEEEEETFYGDIFLLNFLLFYLWMGGFKGRRWMWRQGQMSGISEIHKEPI